MFIFVAGTKVKHQSVGEYADYCPLHRGLHTFDMQQVQSKNHLYGIEVGKGKHQGHIGVGQDVCRFTRPIDAIQIQSVPAAERWARRLETESLLKSNPASLPQDQRIVMFHESVHALEAALEVPEEVTSRAMARVALPAFASFLLFAILGIVGLPWSVLGWLMAVSMAVMLFGSIAANEIASHSYKSEVMTALAAGAIQPLMLDAETIKAEMKVAKKAGLGITRSLKKIDLSPTYPSPTSQISTLIS